MPLYEYKCPNGHLFDVFHGMNDPKPEACEVCGAGPLQVVLQPVAVHYKGSGFYSTDYGRGSRKQKDGGSGDGSAGAASGSDGKAGSSSGGDSGPSSEPKKTAEA
jgi:putative FmdB family regulatory protein